MSCVGFTKIVGALRGWSVTSHIPIGMLYVAPEERRKYKTYIVSLINIFHNHQH